jgi:hypothetical protein
MIAEDKKKLLDQTIPHEKKMAEFFGKIIHHPFLDKAVEACGMETSSAVYPPLRKKALRDVAEMLGFHSLSMKEKRSAQYSSGAMAIIKKVCKNNNITYAELIEKLSREEV